ncbi:exonuclease v chloroplastic [Phtheirospermum japonicum]|uniref:Exonuclease v chloroplastic n=1 Tax=Phtheirospermum japonicum TaxID=374723 RepID=A0A830BAF8_9LAMI|nr:exonuclease v chloroplastic [Phtheirospermum japonicum]
MALVKAAFANAIRPAQFHRTSGSIGYIIPFSKRGLSVCSESGSHGSGRVKKKIGSPDSFPQRLSPFSVCDIIETEWCEKQKEFKLLFGEHEITKAMKAGKARHAELEEEVMPRAKVGVKSAEELWARTFMKSIYGVNQLSHYGLTRELPIICRAEESIWIVGKVDEIRMPLSSSNGFVTLVETKTREKATLPGEAQIRKGRFQLMLYKHMWDMLVAGNFSPQEFIDNFSLNPNHKLSPKVIEHAAKSGFPLQTLNDLVTYFGNSCCLQPQADNQLLLRYELQEDQSLLGEEKFWYDADWVKAQIKSCLEVLVGEREARYAPQDERWKCKCCRFATICPANSGMQNKE